MLILKMFSQYRATFFYSGKTFPHMGWQIFISLYSILNYKKGLFKNENICIFKFCHSSHFWYDFPSFEILGNFVN